MKEILNYLCINYLYNQIVLFNMSTKRDDSGIDSLLLSTGIRQEPIVYKNTADCEHHNVGPDDSLGAGWSTPERCYDCNTLFPYGRS